MENLGFRAFDDATFVDTWATDNAANAANAAVPAPENSAAAHDRLLLRENVNFMEVLAGGDSSNGVPQVARSVVDAQSPEVQGAKSALYDTFTLSYIRAYGNFDIISHAFLSSLPRCTRRTTCST